MDFWPEEGDGEAGEAGPRSEVEQGLDAMGEGAGAEDGLEEVAAEDGLGVADGGEVGAGVPFLEKSEVGFKLCRGIDV